MGILIHGTNYYPYENRYEWAETLQFFARMPNLMDLYSSSLMLSADNTQEIENETHWEQDKASKFTR